MGFIGAWRSPDRLLPPRLGQQADICAPAFPQSGRCAREGQQKSLEPEGQETPLHANILGGYCILAKEGRSRTITIPSSEMGIQPFREQELP